MLKKVVKNEYNEQNKQHSVLKISSVEIRTALSINRWQ
jgi:hypothetical protein